MQSRLRLIAVHVEEPRPQRYEWVLTERNPEDEWIELDRSKDGVATYKQAMANGLLSLQALAGDLDTGPREQGDPAPKHDTSADAPESPPAKRSLFGFGPAR